MPAQPHNFPTLRENGSPHYRRSVLLLGAGMSYGLVPGPGPLLAEKRASAEASLSLTSAVPRLLMPEPNHLYAWADDIIDQLSASNDINPKLKVATSLDIPSERRWLGPISTQRNKPRHRVVARFAREGLWEEIWSLNWDCIQESAFENVGIARDGKDAQLLWPTVFHCFITAAECSGMGEPYSVKIIKPHGCVMALVEAEKAEKAGNRTRALQLSERFLITASELATLAPGVATGATQLFVFARLCDKLCSLPFVVAGWSASEAYLLDHIDNQVRPALDERDPLAGDELSVIDIKFNNEGHARLAGFYSKDRDTAHIIVDPIDFDLDQLFLWLQALYAVGQLGPWTNASDKSELDDLFTLIQEPSIPGLFVIQWTDNFLPVWVRLCWRSGLIACRNRAGQRVKAEDIDLESRDEHIPWTLPGIERPELTAAGRLLTALHRSTRAATWDFEKFPGGMYQDNHLIIPLPAWYPDNTIPNDLCGLKPLVDAIKQHGDGYVDKLSVLLLHIEGGIAIPDARKRTLKETVARHISIARFARGIDIGEIELEAL